MRGAQAGAAPVQQLPGDTDPHLPSRSTAGFVQKPIPNGHQREGRAKGIASHWVSIHNHTVTFPTFRGALYECY